MKTLLATTAIIAASLAGAASAQVDLTAALAKIDNAYAKFDQPNVPTDVIDELKELVYKVENDKAVFNIDFGELSQDADGKYVVGAVDIHRYDFTTGNAVLEDDGTTIAHAATTSIADHSKNVVDLINEDMFGTNTLDFNNIELVKGGIAGGHNWTVVGDGFVAEKLEAEILVDLNKIQGGLNDFHNDLFGNYTNSLAEVLDGVDSLTDNVETFNIAVDALNATEADVINGGGGSYVDAVRIGATDVDLVDGTSERTEAARSITDDIVNAAVN